MPAPLRPRDAQEGGDGREQHSNESLFISALIDSGNFTPERFGVNKEDFIAWEQLVTRCYEYQAAAQTAPPRSLVSSWEPAFLFHDTREGERPISASWLATALLREVAERDLRRRGRTMALSLQTGDLEAAFEAIAGVTPPKGYAAPAISIFDLPALDEVVSPHHIPTPWPSLNRAIGGGIAVDEFLLLQARFGHGKSWLAVAIAAQAAKAGYKVGYISLEMPHRQITSRVLKMLAGRDTILAGALASDDLRTYKQAVAAIQARTPGLVEVYDPSLGSIASLGRLDEVARSSDLVVLDHLGLMSGPDGRRSTDDWRVMATVSNRCREITLATTTPLVGVVQANRSGEHPGTMAVPKPSEIAQSDALGQDATVVVGMKRLSKKILKASTTKVREGESQTFFLRFDPGGGRIEEMAKETALEYAAVDDPFGDG